MAQNREHETHVRELFGRNLREARRAARITQIELGQRAKVDRAMIGKFENGVSQPRLETVVRLARALPVEIGQLLRDI